MVFIRISYIFAKVNISKMGNNFDKVLLQTHCHSELWNGQLACFETDKATSFEPNVVHKLLPVYIYGLIEQGHIKIGVDEEIIEAGPHDLIIYMPGLDQNTVEASEDLKSITLYVTSDFATDNNIQRQIMQTAYFPIMHLHSPVIHLGDEEYKLLFYNLHAMLDHLKTNHAYRQEAVQTVYSLFLIDLMSIQSRMANVTKVSPREENVFITFVNLVKENYLAHHDLDFYASKENITKTYLSRIVKKVTGRTVQDFINELLLMEACSLLRFSDKSMSEIACHLHFSDQASFSKFFSRLKRLSPMAYRNKYKV